MLKKSQVIYDQIVSTRLSYMVVFLLIAALMVMSYRYYEGDLNNHTIVLYGGLIASLVAVLIQFLMGWNEHREIEILKTLGIRNILTNRKGVDHYRQLLKSATHQIDVLGVTANRFLNDFADPASEDKVLLDNLRQNQELRVRLLLPEKEFLFDPDDKAVFESVQRKLTALAGQFPDRFNYRYFLHHPVHSLVRVDNEAIVGPVFPHVQSKHTPSIQIEANSKFVEGYLKYFDEEWNGAAARPH